MTARGYSRSSATTSEESDTNRFGKFALDQRARRLLVRRIGVGVQEADRDRLDAVIDQLAHRRAHLVGIERRDDAPVAVHPLADLQPVAARHQRVGKARGTGRRCRSAARSPFRGMSRKPCVVSRPSRAPRRSMIALVTSVVPCTISADVGERDAGLGGERCQALRAPRPKDPAAWSGICRARCRRREKNEVGEGAADIEADPCHACDPKFSGRMLGAFAPRRNANRAPPQDAAAGQTYSWLWPARPKGALVSRRHSVSKSRNAREQGETPCARLAAVCSGHACHDRAYRRAGHRPRATVARAHHPRRDAGRPALARSDLDHREHLAACALGRKRDSAASRAVNTSPIERSARRKKARCRRRSVIRGRFRLNSNGGTRIRS